MSNYALAFEDISIESISDEQFDLMQSVYEAKSILKNLVSDDLYDSRLRLDFDKDVWVVPNNKGGTIIFNFNNLESLLANSPFNKTESIKRIKCWITSRLRSHSSEHARALYRRLLFAIEKTDFFLKDNSEDFAEFLRTTTDHSNHEKVAIIQVTLNYLDFNLLSDLFDAYDKNFYVISKSLKPEDNRRSLPPVKEVITFSMWLEHFYKDEFAKDKVSPLLIRFYPVIIWWKLTSIIPLRPSEFCKIKRNALRTVNEKYYLKLPRVKNKKNTQIITDILISKELGDIISNYIELTNEFGRTDTLISYRSINSTYSSQYQDNTKFTKFDFNVFNYSDLQYAIDLFHDEILANKYNVSVIPLPKDRPDQDKKTYEISKRISPGDTRHLAILSLINQKYHPIEVARLAGHSTLNSYFHYSNHKAYWVDLEVQKLMYKFHKEKSKSYESNVEKQQSLWSEISNRALLKPPTSEFREKKELGYCTDNLKRCFTDCVFCNHWRISTEEFNENQHLIQTKISQQKQEANGLLTDILNTMQAFNVDEFAAINPDIKNALDEKLMMLDDAIQKVAKMGLIEEANITND
ncbi:hypothetical protein [Sporosarcina sp. G11-34]|uniref:hypothetical protein n=1 Tax=Sporosarcina sp. G11-34 TaxID=2849605 RepID=UPI0022A8EBDE|nr:hypothetical protein [Sporosarcina sp. G11-34]MCZ2259411.1 hypothetical protein [Sporosarcina sp. G11-34]